MTKRHDWSIDMSYFSTMLISKRSTASIPLRTESLLMNSRSFCILFSAYSLTNLSDISRIINSSASYFRRSLKAIKREWCNECVHVFRQCNIYIYTVNTLTLLIMLQMYDKLQSQLHYTFVGVFLLFSAGSLTNISFQLFRHGLGSLRESCGKLCKLLSMKSECI